MAPPTYIQTADTVFGSVPIAAARTTTAFNVTAGDVLVAWVAGFNSSSTEVPMTIGDSVGSFTWVQKQEVYTGDTQWCYISIWTTTAPSNQTAMTVTFTKKAADDWLRGGSVQTWRGSGGIGATVSDHNQLFAGAQVSYTTQQANSGLAVVAVDWNGDTTARTWVTSVGALTEVAYQAFSTLYTTYAGYHADSGAIGSKTVGLSNPANMKYSIASVEVLGPVTSTSHPKWGRVKI